MYFKRLAVLEILLFLPSFLWAQFSFSTGTAHYIEFDSKLDIAVMKGDAKVDTSSATLTADQITIYRKTNIGHAQGNVVIYKSSQTLIGQEAYYNWEESTGVVVGSSGINPPWVFQGKEMYQVAPKVFRVKTSWITSCDHNPPHYVIRSQHSKIISGHRLNLLNPRLVIDNTAIFWSPFYTRSLLPKKYTLRIVPGQNSRDGLTAKTVLGYPFSPHTQTKFKWDWYERTGNGGGIEHRYFLPNLKGNIDAWLVRDHNADDRPKERRWSVLWNHFHNLTPKLTFNATLDFKSDQKFGDEFSDKGNGTLVENQQRGLLSEAGLTYQMARSSLRADFKRRDRFDSGVSGKSFISEIVFPAVSFATIPLRWKYFPVYTSFSAHYRNETAVRSDPRETLRYQRSASTQIKLKRDIRLWKRWTLTPSAGYDQQWQDRDLSLPDSKKGIFLGNYSAGMDVRRRFFRAVDVTVGYDYVGRTERNSLKVDTKANDHGVITNSLTGSIVMRLGRSSRFSVRSGYNLIRPPKNDPSKFEHLSERITPPVFDFQWALTEDINIFFRETYSLFDTRTRSPLKTPQNTSGEIQFGNLSKKAYFSQGFSYTKRGFGEDSVLNLSNRLTYFLTPKWFVDFSLAYKATGPSGLNYGQFLPVSKALTVTRDLHCWILRMEFSERGDRTEASFYIDLKVNVSQGQRVFGRSADDYFYPYRDSGIDVSDIFHSKTITTEEEKLLERTRQRTQQ